MENSNRIQINGAWYIKEDTITPTTEIEEELDLIFTEQILFENELVEIKVFRMFSDYESKTFYVDSIDVTVTIKATKNKIEIDNPTFLRLLLDGDFETLSSCYEDFGRDITNILKRISKKLVELKWL
jgi:hypothetical protein